MVINFAICWKGLVFLSANRVIPLTPLFSNNLTSYTQSAGNQKESTSLVGSSETTCEGSFDFTSFWKHHKYIDPALGPPSAQGLRALGPQAGGSEGPGSSDRGVASMVYRVYRG